MKIEDVVRYLKRYDKPVKIMEVCGTHTASIAHGGLRSLLSPSIRLVSGPGCPVCVTPASYIDALVELSCRKNNTVLCFGDMMRVPGTSRSLMSAVPDGASVRMIYSPMEAVRLAKENAGITFTVAAVGFETTVPLYCVLLERLIAGDITNVKLLPSVRTMPSALDYICSTQEIDGFICPGHVSAVTGLEPFRILNAKYGRSFAVAGFEPEHILAAIYVILRQLENGHPETVNLYKSTVDDDGQPRSRTLISKYFAECDSDWRGIGLIKSSGLTLHSEYSSFLPDVEVKDDNVTDSPCQCGDVLLGRINPDECPMFGRMCSPDQPVGACMVSPEGACGIWYSENKFH